MHTGENLAPKATDVDQESRDQQVEIKVKSLLQLQKDESQKQGRIDNMFMNLRSAETVRYIIMIGRDNVAIWYLLQVGVCFMIDHTISTGPWINKIKHIRSWSEQLRANHTHLELHMAFVLYTNYDQPPYSRISTLDFTT
jgi:hypothetical protein